MAPFLVTDYRIAVLTPLGVELAAVQAMLDQRHEDLPIERSRNAYVLGELAKHNVVVAVPPSTGNPDAAATANQLINDFPSLQFGLLVGVAGGVPGLSDENDVRLGDVVVGEPTGTNGGVVQFDRGKRLGDNAFQVTGQLNKPPLFLSATLKKLKAQHMQQGSQTEKFVKDMVQRNPRMRIKFSNPGPFNDHLFQSDYKHVDGPTCQECDATMTIDRLDRETSQPHIHYGTIGSSSAVIRDALERDKLGKEHQLLAVDMEAAGVVDALPCLVIKGICDYADSHKNKMWQPYAAAVAAAFAKELLLSIPPQTVVAMGHDSGSSISGSSTHHQAGVSAEILVTESAAQILFKSLAFDGMDARVRNIADPLSHTCEWLFEHPAFKDWAYPQNPNQRGGFLWIKGKPGSGKSTIMKHNVQWAHRLWPNDFIFSYFFNARATGALEKSSLGLYRSLLHHLFERYPDIIEPALNRFKLKIRKGGVESWKLEEVKHALTQSLTILQHEPINIFVDALDEGDEDDVRDMLSFLGGLGSPDKLESSAILNVRVCLSSRPFPYISVKNGVFIVVEEQRGHRIDMRRYIQQKLITDESREMVDLRTKILQRSAGIFLWVVLVVPLLNKAYDKGRSIQDMMLKLEGIPKGLDDLFVNVLDQSDEDIEECITLLQWTLFSKRALTMVEMHLAIRASSDPPRFDDVVESDERLQRYILNTSRGLIEPTSSRPPTLQFIHETIREFLLRQGLAQINASLGKNAEGLSNDKLARGCWQYLSHHAPPIPRRSLQARETENVLKNQLSLLQYTVRYVFRHADIAQMRGVSQNAFIEELSTNDRAKLETYLQVHNLCESEYLRYPLDTPLLIVFAYQSLEFLARSALESGLVNVNESNLAAGLTHRGATTPLRIVSAAGYVDFGKLLLEFGADINAREGGSGTALQAACASGQAHMVQFLMDSGADLNVLGKDGDSALQAACFNGHEQIVKVLLDAGAQWSDDRQGRYGAALQAACSRNNFSIVELLIRAGADVNARGPPYGNTIEAALVGSFEQIVCLLVEYGAQIEEDEVFQQVLSIVCGSQQERPIRRILRYPRNFNSRIEDHVYALHMAYDRYNMRIVGLVVSLAEQNFSKDIRDRIIGTVISRSRGNWPWLIRENMENAARRWSRESHSQ